MLIRTVDDALRESLLKTNPKIYPLLFSEDNQFIATDDSQLSRLLCEALQTQLDQSRSKIAKAVAQARNGVSNTHYLQLQEHLFAVSYTHIPNQNILSVNAIDISIWSREVQQQSNIIDLYSNISDEDNRDKLYKLIISLLSIHFSGALVIFYEPDHEQGLLVPRLQTEGFALKLLRLSLSLTHSLEGQVYQDNEIRHFKNRRDTELTERFPSSVLLPVVESYNTPPIGVLGLYIADEQGFSEQAQHDLNGFHQAIQIVLGRLKKHEDFAALQQARYELEETYMMDVTRDLHDQIGNSSLAIGQALEKLRQAIAQGDLALIEDVTRYVDNEFDKAEKEVRSIYEGGPPYLMRDLGLIPALKQIIEELNTDEHDSLYTSLFAYENFVVMVDEDIPMRNTQDKIVYKPLPTDTETVIYRCVQEARNNMIKHAKATHFEVELVYGKRALHLKIMDNGQGFDPPMVQANTPAQHKPRGLQGMQQRVRNAGGTCQITSAPQQGTTIYIELPLHTET